MNSVMTNCDTESEDKELDATFEDREVEVMEEMEEDDGKEISIGDECWSKVEEEDEEVDEDGKALRSEAD